MAKSSFWSRWKIPATGIIAWALFWVWLAAMQAVCSQEPVSEFMPLHRGEPVVRMVLMEAANEPFAGMVAVAGVALDRIEDSRWPDNRKEVVYQPYQFSAMSLPIKNFSRQQITRARIAVAVAETGYRPCGNVLWYHTEDVSPYWIKRLLLKCKLGEHLFYGDKGENYATR